MLPSGDPEKLSARAKRDLALKPEIARVFEENFEVYGVRKVWRQFKRESFDVARCTVARLMREMGLHGVIRGKPLRTTISDKAAPCPLDHVNRQFHAPAPNALWVSDFTYVSTWTGFVYVAFVIDVYARYVVGWRVSEPRMPALFSMPWSRPSMTGGRRIVAGSSITATEAASTSRSNIPSAWRRQASSRRSAALATVMTTLSPKPSMAFTKAEVIHRRGPWRSFEAVEFATLEWVDWFNRRRLLEPIGNIPPAEAEQNYYAAMDNIPMAA